MHDSNHTDASPIEFLLDLAAYPIHRLDAPEGRALVQRCREDLATTGMFNLTGFVRADALAAAVAELKPLLADGAFRHARRHDIYFGATQPGLPAEHGARREIETSNRTVTGDRTAGTIVRRIYDWAPLPAFLAVTMGKPVLHPMADPLACLNVMGYGDGEGLNWHFDRSQFTVTLLLQMPDAGGEFEYRRNLRSPDDPNYDGVARLLAGRDPEVRSVALSAGTLNVFAGRNTAHRAAPTRGARERIVAVMSFVEQPNVIFSAAERIGFYGRADEL
jgi:2OG-Fe(II) oxygenase superfamily